MTAAITESLAINLQTKCDKFLESLHNPTINSNDTYFIIQLNMLI